MESLTLVIFGITSNLAQIKLIPALYDMAEKGLLPKDFSIIGSARRKMERLEFEKYLDETLHQENIHHQHPIKKEAIRKLCSQFSYLDGNLQNPSFYQKLTQNLRSQNIIFYLATYPDLYDDIFKNLQKAGLNRQKNGWVRLMIEKPIGNDLKSAKKLNQLLEKYFTENQIYRLDHYLGKETLQNILTFRFGNGIFEPLINKDFIDHIQITAAEDFGIGARGGYYDSIGALKDVGQNHQLQMLAFATMDAPSEFSNEAITKERLKILQKLTPLPDKIIFGQYQGYKKEVNVNPNSQTDTFYTFKTFINNPRFKDMPIYIRAGKKLAQTVTEINIVFKSPINRLFKHLDCGDEPNILIYRIAPNEGIVLKIITKVPGHQIKVEPEYMQFCYRQSDTLAHSLPDPYEKLLVDTIRGEQTFFNDAAEVEAQWEFIDPLFKSREKPFIYKPGSWGPKEANQLIEADDRCWLKPPTEFCQI